MINSISLVLIVFSVFLSGCKPIPKKETFFNINQYNYKYCMPSPENIDDDMILKEIQKQIIKISKYKPVRDFNTGTSGVYDRKGINVEVNKSKNKIIYTYINGERYSNPHALYLSTIQGTTAYDVIKNNNCKVVSLYSPSKLITKKTRNVIGITQETLDTEGNIFDDINKTLAKIKPNLTISKIYKAQIKSKENPETYLSMMKLNSNFEVSKINKLEDNSFEVKFYIHKDGKKYKSEAEVLPYTSGSIIKITTSQIYSINSDGTNTFDSNYKKYFNNTKNFN